MTAQTLSKSENLFRRLRSTRVLLIHPDDADSAMMLAHLKRIGCQVDSVWPAPDNLPSHIDVVLFLIDRIHDKGSISWMSSSATIARIAIIAFETPEILTELERLNVHGVLSKPIRVFGIMAALTTAIGLSRHEKRLKQRIYKLDETLKARRKIEKAVAILSQTRNISEEDAYKKLRDRSMSTKETIESIATAIIEANEI
ncbi:MAG: ANTAR domain-containing response regulator [Granulosicoccus sp.]